MSHCQSKSIETPGISAASDFQMQSKVHPVLSQRERRRWGNRGVYRGSVELSRSKKDGSFFE
jgi:hypothetical protein